ncbi:ROK family transcriptional regulator [Microbacterium sp. 18062]|uniref:ROK family transcriptional regulator n=1 Tax=Microbacterium sp. 18062 TaxID=2681410 RepID=UPI001359543A|nr:ROK family transcriptional regulator [Microbacterium sp. 18062]
MTGARSEGLSSTDVRAHNLGLVLSQLDRAGAAARSELARSTGLARGAITLLVSELREAGLVRDAPAGTSDAPRPGRPRERLEVDGDAIALIGLQFVVDEVLMSAVDLAGRPLLREARGMRTPHGDPDALVEQLASVIDDIAGRLRAQGVTPARLVVVVPAPVTRSSETIPVAIDLGWIDVDLAALLRARIDEPPLGIRVVNDANAAAYAEFAELQAEWAPGMVTDMVYLKSDTGIGGGAIVEGEMLAGPDGIAFEPGHVVVVPDGDPCACGKSGCLVTVAGPEIVLTRAGLAAYRDAHGLPQALDELVRRYRAGEAGAVAALDEALGWIRLVLANCVALLQPQFVVVGGYLADLVEELRGMPRSWLSSLGGLAPGAGPEGDVAVGVRPAVHGLFSGVDGAVLHDRRELLLAPDRLRAVGAGWGGNNKFNT